MTSNVRADALAALDALRMQEGVRGPTGALELPVTGPWAPSTRLAHACARGLSGPPFTWVGGESSRKLFEGALDALVDDGLAENDGHGHYRRVEAR